MKNRNDLKINAIFNFIKTLSTTVFPLITFSYASRILAPSNLGKINFGSSYLSYFTLLASLGISAYAIRECSSVRDNRKELSDLASQIFSLNICSTLVSYLFMFLSLFLYKKDENYKLIIIIQSTTILFTTLGSDWINQALEDFAFTSTRTFIFQSLSLISVLLFVKKPTDYIIYAIISTLASSGASIANIIYRKKFCDIRFTLHFNLRKHLKPVMHLFILQMAQTVFTNVGTLMLGLIHTDYEVGIFSVAFNIVNSITLVSDSLLWVTIPRLSYYFSKNNYDELNQLLSNIFGLFMLFGLPCVTGIIMLSREIVVLISGGEFLIASSSLVLLILSFMVNLFGDSFFGNMVLIPSGNEKSYMRLCILAAISSIICNFIFIPKLKFNGVALARLITSILIATVLLVTKDKRIRIDSIQKRMISPLLGCLYIVIVCLVANSILTNNILKIIASVFIGAIGYFLIQILLKNQLVEEVKYNILERIKNWKK